MHDSIWHDCVTSEIDCNDTAIWLGGFRPSAIPKLFIELSFTLKNTTFLVRKTRTFITFRIERFLSYLLQIQCIH